ncbi:hypothetical protein F183_A37330 [Bryobacterales bacterium F-183]|nr:hypothetical protein F183_A37330 [Bryobacterales bacterium F-183]
MTSPFPKAYADFVQRLRVPAGFILLGGFVLLAHPTAISILNSLPVIFLGLALRAWAAGHLEKNQNLAISGPYAYTRNPLYLGTLIVAAGFCVAANDPWLPFLFAAIFFLIYIPVMYEESAHLTKLFSGYAAYAQGVPLLVPRLTAWTQATKRFSWGLFWRNKEQKAWYGALAGLALLAGKMQFLRYD